MVDKEAERESLESLRLSGMDDRFCKLGARIIGLKAWAHERWPPELYLEREYDYDETQLGIQCGTRILRLQRAIARGRFTFLNRKETP